MSLTAKRTAKSGRPAHHANNSASAFRNPWSSALAPTWAELLSVSFPLGWYSADSLPGDARPIKVVKPDWGASSSQRRPDTTKPDHIVATWLGHAGAMAEFSAPHSHQEGLHKSTYFVFDPIFSFRAGPTQYTGPSRIRESPCRVEDFPGCHAVLISHNHYDHLDLATVVDINRHFPATKWFVPLGNKTWLTASGVEANKVVELDWWQTWEGNFSYHQFSSSEGQSWFKISCVPAQHTTGRRGFDAASTLWCGWVVERYFDKQPEIEPRPRRGAVYHAGDTGYRRIEGSEDICPAFKEIGNTFGGFDVSFIPIWRGGSLGFVSYAGLRLLHRNVPAAFHCSPVDAINIHRDVKSKNTVAIHFGTFVGSEKESNEAVSELYQACTDGNIKALESREATDNGRAGTLDIGGSLLVEFE